MTDTSARISSEEIKKSIMTWADITTLSLELKRAAMRERYPGLGEAEISELIRKEISILKMDLDDQ